MNTNDDAAARIVAMAMDPDKDGEKYLFSLMRKEQEFTLGLSTLLACLRFAELGGGVPRISAAWWRRAASVFWEASLVLARQGPRCWLWACMGASPFCRSSVMISASIILISAGSCATIRCTCRR